MTDEEFEALPVARCDAPPGTYEIVEPSGAEGVATRSGKSAYIWDDSDRGRLMAVVDYKSYQKHFLSKFPTLFDDKPPPYRFGFNSFRD